MVTEAPIKAQSNASLLDAGTNQPNPKSHSHFFNRPVCLTGAGNRAIQNCVKRSEQTVVSTRFRASGKVCHDRRLSKPISRDLLSASGHYAKVAQGIIVSVVDRSSAIQNRNQQ